MSIAAPLQVGSIKAKRSNSSLSGGALKCKLTIGASNDPLEREADRVAEEVLAMPEHSEINNTLPSIQRLTGHQTNSSDEAPASVERVLANPGRPLDTAFRRDMEQRFGYDFSQVRIHTDANAMQSAREVNAIAYTVGSSIAFDAGQYAPQTLRGQRLIAHELAHVVQQTGATRTYFGRSGDKRGQSYKSLEVVHSVQQEKEYPAEINSRSDLHQRLHKSISFLNIEASLRRTPGDIQTEEILELLTDHMHNYRLIVDKLKMLGKEKTKAIARTLSTDIQFFEDLGGSNEGIEILISFWQASSDDALLKEQITRALTQRSVPYRKPTQSDKAALDRINTAIKSDHSKLIDYLSGPFPLRLPVELYEPGNEREAHVYYDPALMDDGGVPMRFRRIGKKLLLPILFIKLGPSALSSNDTYLLSVLYHEHVHYKQALSLRKSESTISEDEDTTRSIIEGGASGRSDPDLEVEAYSRQLIEYIITLEERKAAHIMAMLAKHAAVALPFQWDAARNRIVSFINSSSITGISAHDLNRRKAHYKSKLLKIAKLAERNAKGMNKPALDKLHQLEEDIQRA